MILAAELPPACSSHIPGIPVLMPGERMPQGNKGIIGYLRALQEFDKAIPGLNMNPGR